jgi:hypothetical protein
VSSGARLAGPVDAPLDESTDQSPDATVEALRHKVIELDHYFVKFTTPSGQLVHAKLHLRKSRGEKDKRLYLLAFGYEIAKHPGVEEDTGTSTQPDPNTPGWQVVRIGNVDFDVMITVP